MRRKILSLLLCLSLVIINSPVTVITYSAPVNGVDDEDEIPEDGDEGPQALPGDIQAQSSSNRGSRAIQPPKISNNKALIQILEQMRTQTGILNRWNADQTWKVVLAEWKAESAEDIKDAAPWLPRQEDVDGLIQEVSRAYETNRNQNGNMFKLDWNSFYGINRELIETKSRLALHGVREGEVLGHDVLCYHTARYTGINSYKVLLPQSAVTPAILNMLTLKALNKEVYDLYMRRNIPATCIDAFISRSNVTKYWDYQYPDTPVDNTTCMTWAEALHMIAELMNVYGEYVLTKKEASALAKYYLTDLPVTNPQFRYDCIYLAARGILDEIPVMTNTPSISEILTILMRVKDEDSRLTNKVIQIVGDEKNEVVEETKTSSYKDLVDKLVNERLKETTVAKQKATQSGIVETEDKIEETTEETEENIEEEIEETTVEGFVSSQNTAMIKVPASAYTEDSWDTAGLHLFDSNKKEINMDVNKNGLAIVGDARYGGNIIFRVNTKKTTKSVPKELQYYGEGYIGGIVENITTGVSGGLKIVKNKNYSYERPIAKITIHYIPEKATQVYFYDHANKLMGIGKKTNKYYDFITISGYVDDRIARMDFYDDRQTLLKSTVRDTTITSNNYDLYYITDPSNNRELLLPKGSYEQMSEKIKKATQMTDNAISSMMQQNSNNIVQRQVAAQQATANANAVNPNQLANVSQLDPNPKYDMTALPNGTMIDNESAVVKESQATNDNIYFGDKKTLHWYMMIKDGDASNWDSIYVNVYDKAKGAALSKSRIEGSPQPLMENGVQVGHQMTVRTSRIYSDKNNPLQVDVMTGAGITLKTYTLIPSEQNDKLSGGGYYTSLANDPTTLIGVAFSDSPVNSTSLCDTTKKVQSAEISLQLASEPASVIMDASANYVSNGIIYAPSKDGGGSGSSQLRSVTGITNERGKFKCIPAGVTNYYMLEEGESDTVTLIPSWSYNPKTENDDNPGFYSTTNNNTWSVANPSIGYYNSEQTQYAKADGWFYGIWMLDRYEADDRTSYYSYHANDQGLLDYSKEIGGITINEYGYCEGGNADSFDEEGNEDQAGLPTELANNLKGKATWYYYSNLDFDMPCSLIADDQASSAQAWENAGNVDIYYVVWEVNDELNEVESVNKLTSSGSGRTKGSVMGDTGWLYNTKLLLPRSDNQAVYIVDIGDDGYIRNVSPGYSLGDSYDDILAEIDEGCHSN